MLAHNKTSGSTTASSPISSVISCDGCYYCDLYSLAEYAYRDRMYSPSGLQYPSTITPPPHLSPYSIPSSQSHVMLESEPSEEEDDDDDLKTYDSFQHHNDDHNQGHQPHIHARIHATQPPQTPPLPPNQAVLLPSSVHPRIHPDVAMAFLLSLDLLRQYQPVNNRHEQQIHQHTQDQKNYHPEFLQYPLESRDALFQAIEKNLIHHECHRRSSSFGSTTGIKVEEEGGEGGRGGGGGFKDGGSIPFHTPAVHPADLMPHYQIDPNMRAPGGSLGGVEGALKFQDVYSLRVPPTYLAPIPPSPPPLIATPKITTTYLHPITCSSPSTSAVSSYPTSSYTKSAPTPIPLPVYTPLPPPVTSSAPASAPASVPASVPSTTTIPAWLHYPFFRSQSDGHTANGEGRGGGIDISGVSSGNKTDEEELGAFWELLDSELRPIQPVRSCPESISIFSEHKEMAKKYLVLQQEIFNLRQNKGKLEEKLSQTEKLEQLGNQRYQDKIRELENKRENLRHNHSKLRQQLEQIHVRQMEQQRRKNNEEDGCGGSGIGRNLPLSPP